MKLCMLALLAASMTSFIEGVLELSPYAMFSKIVVLKRTGSCDTIPSCARIHLRSSDVTLTPSSRCRWAKHSTSVSIRNGENPSGSGYKN